MGFQFNRALILIITILTLTRCGGGGTGNLLNNPTPVASLSVVGGPLYDFGSHLLNIDTEREFLVTNSGAELATQLTGNFYFSIAFSYKGGAFPGNGGTCGETLASNENCTLVVIFNPKSLGKTETTLQLSYYNGLSTVITSYPILRGTGI